MHFFVYIANAFVIPPAMTVMSYLYKVKGKEITFRKLYISIALISITILITTLQFIVPEIIPVLDRNKEALFSGEVWRLITPLFIQPQGLWQCLFNGIFFAAFLPLGEFIYGRKILLIYFGAGLVGQLANYYWNRGGGGSSTALFGVMGSLFTYVLLNRKTLMRPYLYLSLTGFVGAIILCFFQDGHAPALLAGGVIALWVSGKNESLDVHPLNH